MRSAAYATDNVEPLASGSGRLTFHVDVRHPTTIRTVKRIGRLMCVGRNVVAAMAPATKTHATYTRAASGSAAKRRSRRSDGSRMRRGYGFQMTGWQS